MTPSMFWPLHGSDLVEFRSEVVGIDWGGVARSPIRIAQRVDLVSIVRLKLQASLTRQAVVSLALTVRFC